MNTRLEITDALKRHFKKDSTIYAVWEGGSAATNQLDDLSDLDILVVCEDKAVESIFASLDTFLDTEFGIKSKYRVPEPTWHGFSQTFYQIVNTAPLFYLDISVIKESVPDKFTDERRHGSGVMWFERKQIIDQGVKIDLEAKGKRMFNQAVDSAFLYVLETKKAIERERFSEAFAMYYSFVSRNLAVMLNLKYRPEKVDFGLRYAFRDYGDEDFLLVTNALKVSDLKSLEKMFDLVLARFKALKLELTV